MDTIIQGKRRQPERAALSLAEGAASTAIGLSNFKQLVAERKIRSFKIGRRVLVTPQAIADYIKSLEDAATK